MNWNEIWQNFLDFLIELGTTVGLKLLYAILVIVVGNRLVKFLIKKLRKSKLFLKIDDSVAHFLANLISILLRASVFVAAAMIIGVPASSFLAVITSCGVAIGLALQGSLSNLAGGIMILIFKPFRTGDFIECEGVLGTVEDITIFYTELVTPDQKMIHFPNGTLTSSQVINYSQKPTRRVSITVKCAYGSDIDAVKGILMGVLESNPLVLKDPAPFVALETCSDSSLDFVVRGWCDTKDYWTVQYALTEESVKALNAHGISIPFPQMDVHIKDK